MFDAGHVPLFGLLSLVVLALSFHLRPRPPERRYRHYLFAFVVATFAGAMVEVFQFVGHLRFGEIGDVGRNMVGSAVFLAIAATFDSELVRRYRFPRHRRAIVTVSILVVTAVASPVAVVGAALVARNAAFPRLNGFESNWDFYFLRTSIHAELSRVAAPAAIGDRKVAAVTFHPSRNAILVLRDPYPDWEGFDRLVLELYLPSDRPLAFGIKIEDVANTRAVRPVFERELEVEPGISTISIPLSEIRRAPRGREMNMSNITGLALVARQPAEVVTLYLLDLRLE